MPYSNAKTRAGRPNVHLTSQGSKFFKQIMLTGISAYVKNIICTLYNDIYGKQQVKKRKIRVVRITIKENTQNSATKSVG
jgi:hypothetical protein